MKLCHWLLAAIFLSAAVGCRQHGFGPIAIPAEYQVVPAETKPDEDVTAQLMLLQNPPLLPYIISPQDHFNVSVYEHSDLNMTDLVVTPDGFISLPLVGPVRIGGMTLIEATDAITEKLSAFVKKPRVALIPVLIGGYNFTIVGQVNKPGRYPISIGQTRVLDAIALGSGFTQGLFQGDTVEMADLTHAYVARDGKILPVNFAKLIEGDSLQNILLQNNDYIYIPSVMSTTVTVLGEVNSQTYVTYKDGLTLIAALASTGGLRETHNSMVKIIRGGLVEPLIYEVDIDKILNGKAQDFLLRTNDIVYVPRDAISDWNVMVRKILPSLQALSMLAGPFGNPSGFLSLSND